MFSVGLLSSRGAGRHDYYQHQQFVHTYAPRENSRYFLIKIRITRLKGGKASFCEWTDGAFRRSPSLQRRSLETDAIRLYAVVLQTESRRSATTVLRTASGTPRNCHLGNYCRQLGNEPPWELAAVARKRIRRSERRVSDFPRHRVVF